MSKERMRAEAGPPPLVVSGGGNDAGQSLSGREVIDTLFRQKWRILLLWALVSIATASYVVLTPAEYESEMTILVKDKRVDLGVTPSGGEKQDAASSDAQLATELQLLSSRELFRTVVLETHLAKSNSPADIERALANLRKAIRVSPVLKSSLIQVKYSDTNAARSAQVLRALAGHYLNKHLELHSSPGSFEFFDMQAGEYETKLRAAHNRLLEFQAKTKIVLLSEQKDLTLRKMLEMESALRDARALKSETELRAAKLREQMGAMGTRITTQRRKIPNQYSVERLNTLLTELQNKRTELLTKFLPGDRMIGQVDRQIADTRTALQNAAGMISTEEATDVNPVRQAVEGELARADVTLTGLDARIYSVSKQIGEMRAELSRMESAAPDDQILLREVNSAEQNYILYSKKREEARMAREMDRQKLANVAIVDPPREPAFPKSKMGSGAPAGFLLGTILVLALCFALGHRRNVVQTPWELESMTGLQVLATIPLGNKGMFQAPGSSQPPSRPPVLELEGHVQK